MFITLLGAPGCGKGTQAKRICAYYNVPHISTGDIFRQEIKNNPLNGGDLAGYINEGNLVPDEIVIKFTKERLRQEDCKNGALLDGFPRTLPQAKALDEICFKYKVLNLIVDRVTLIKRVLGRRVCGVCAKNYNISENALSDYACGDCESISSRQQCDYCELKKIRQQCDCGGELFSRDDDNAEVFTQRLKVYDEWTAPLIDYYQKKGNLISIDGFGQEDAVFERIKQALGK